MDNGKSIEILLWGWGQTNGNVTFFLIVQHLVVFGLPVVESHSVLCVNLRDLLAGISTVGHKKITLPVLGSRSITFLSAKWVVSEGAFRYQDFRCTWDYRARINVPCSPLSPSHPLVWFAVLLGKHVLSWGIVRILQSQFLALSKGLQAVAYQSQFVPGLDGSSDI